MANQYSTTVRNARLDAVESTIGTAPKLQIRTGSPPANCAAADTGTLLVEFTLPSDWMADASNATKQKSGTWEANAVASGIAGHYRIKNNAGTVCHIQGTVGISGADLLIDNTNIASGQLVRINTYQWTEPES
jgi:hypothetical protein